eukprot:CAMPEP_0198201256 /NCGR_PEP_ID=MMETSP1445-20131203/3995_1 /TAXON_ID=36898 /ORGANISM="Pyramimonas sp., Strain CCMP2087" /LENGTH=844 /DNA_ID=CAMNT_0043871471 /DNA_START=191 /DNA_END=2721 /DNA_ORIENTATION=-
MTQRLSATKPYAGVLDFDKQTHKGPQKRMDRMSRSSFLSSRFLSSKVMQLARGMLPATSVTSCGVSLPETLAARNLGPMRVKTALALGNNVRHNAIDMGSKFNMHAAYLPLTRSKHSNTIVKSMAGGDGNNNGGGTATAADLAEERISDVELHTEASESYLAYAMSVIVGRALPDARDGLKPVHRRILFSMHELGLASNKPFRKCARVVGEVLGKYHPHGDQAVYNSMVRMAQDFSMREPLINGHGNFGSLDADPAAAMRYTECKLQEVTELALLADLGADTVEFADNFDGSTQEPTVLPAAVPNLLVNGSSGIAVGMATFIPPHNLAEVVEAMCYLVDHPDATTLQLMKFLPAPDFPTGGVIMDNDNELLKVYETGRGGFTLRGKTHVEQISKSKKSVEGKEAIVITEIPYMTNKASLVERIAELVNARELEGVADLRDESDRNGVRVVVELKRGASSSVVLNNLFKHTRLQVRINCIHIALVGNRPLTLPLTDILKTFVDFRVNVIRRRSQFHLAKAETRQHIVQGLLTALASMDAIVELIRRATNAGAAAKELAKVYGLSAAQTDAVLSMPLRRLTGMEKGKLEAEDADLSKVVADLQDLLNNDARVLSAVKREARAITKKFGSKRRTDIVMEAGELSMDELVPNSESIVLLSERGFIKRMPIDTFGAQSRNTRGKQSGKLRENDKVLKMMQCKDHDKVLLFSERGVVYSVRAYDIPEGTRQSSGVPLQQLGMGPDKMTAMMSLDSLEAAETGEALVMLTAKGKIKKTLLPSFMEVRPSGIIAIQLEDGDKLKWVQRAKPADSVMVGASSGMVIHFQMNEKQLRASGRSAKGVNVMKMGEG